MKDAVISKLNQSLYRIMKPLVRILLRNGIAYGSFVELIRKTYVDVATENLKKSGIRPTISAISGMTGLTRKETKKLSETELPDFVNSDLKFNRAARVVSAWQNDRRFQNKDGKPKSLELEGKGSFAELAKDYSGDIPIAAMLKILRSAGCVEEDSGQWRLVSTSYISNKDPLEKLQILGVDTFELLATIDHNLTAADDELRFQRKVSNFRVDSRHIPEFRAVCSRKTQKLLEELDTWLSAHEVEKNSAPAEGCYVALGAYYYEDLNVERKNEL